MTKRIGYACKTLHPDQNQPARLLEEIQRKYSEKSTTVAWMNRQKRSVAEDKLWEIMKHNAQAALNLVEYVGSLPDGLRMVRLGSNQLPLYTERSWSYFWRQNDIQRECERAYNRVGEAARRLDVRLSMHPGQFCCLGSSDDNIVARSIEEFEYHADLIRWMGYGQKFQDFKCNVHVSGRKGVDGVLSVLGNLTPEARNTITFENDEYSVGIDDLIKLKDSTALVFDNHHHFIFSGQHLTPQDDRYKLILESWQGVRPAMHYSVSKEEYLVNTDVDKLPSMESLLAEGYKKGKLRAHSDYYTNNALNDLMYEFWQYSDIMCESKMKNLASAKLYEYFKQKYI
jgi:UV DNA damage endonuclease